MARALGVLALLVLGELTSVAARLGVAEPAFARVGHEEAHEAASEDTAVVLAKAHQAVSAAEAVAAHTLEVGAATDAAAAIVAAPAFAEAGLGDKSSAVVAQSGSAGSTVGFDKILTTVGKVLGKVAKAIAIGMKHDAEFNVARASLLRSQAGGMVGNVTRAASQAVADVMGIYQVSAAARAVATWDEHAGKPRFQCASQRLSCFALHAPPAPHLPPANCRTPSATQTTSWWTWCRTSSRR